MSFLYLQDYINDAKCAQKDENYSEAAAALELAEPLYDEAVLRVKYLAESVSTWSFAIVENITVENDCYVYTEYIKADSKEMLKIVGLVEEYAEFKKQLENDKGYQEYRQLLEAFTNAVA